jgi:hypothetical protein
MRAVRCDVCGAKAMIAAGKCPGCGHLFGLRDGFGELPPLAYCSSCDSYYPESLGSCRWCGTKPARPPIGPRVWYGAGVALAVLMGVLWVLRNGAARNVAPPRPVAVQPAPPPSASSPLDSDTTITRALAETSDSLPPPIAVVDSVRRDSSVTENSTKPVIATESPKKSVVTAGSATRQAKRWVRSHARHWVVVRAGPSRDSRIVAWIGPSSRVELGESRGSWRRIRTKGLTGWVEPRSSFELVAAR